MIETLPTHSAASSGARSLSARFLILLSAFFLLLQVSATNYGTANAHQAEAMFWFVFGAGLLGLVYRKHSRVARGVLVVIAMVGAIVYGIGAFADGGAAFLALTYLGQSLPLLSPPVRRHVTRD